VSTNLAQEQTLGYYLGIFGSAFEVSLKDIISMSAKNLAKIKSDLPSYIAQPLHETLKLILATALSEIRLFPAQLPNIGYQLADCPEQKEKTVELVDAGIDFNLPVVPLLNKNRTPDILIVYDSSSTVNGAPELKRAMQYAARKGIKLPDINYNFIDQKAISVFKDESDNTVPIVIYIPRIKNDQYNSMFDPDACIKDDFCNTFNFAYSLEEFNLLSGLVAFTLLQEEKTIKQTIKQMLHERYMA
jgi:hypothetical protein